MSAQREQLRAWAPAKVNLYLDVLGKRSDGYHDLRSVVVPIGLFDEVELERTGREIETHVTSELPACMTRLPDGSDGNIATRAARLLRKTTGCRGGASVRLRKHIPVGGGLGGGSADAAAALVGLNDLWQTGLSRQELMSLGAQVGCDIPALIHGGAVVMEGRGEKISPLAVAGPVSHWWIVVVNPGVMVSTRDIYARFRCVLTSDGERYRNMVCALTEGDLDLAARSLFNRLQETVCRKYPLLGILAERLERAGALGALLCGSGASLFGLARDEEHARRIAESLARPSGAPIWCHVTRILPDGVMVAHGPLEA